MNTKQTTLFNCNMTDEQATNNNKSTDLKTGGFDQYSLKNFTVDDYFNMKEEGNDSLTLGDLLFMEMERVTDGVDYLVDAVIPKDPKKASLERPIRQAMFKKARKFKNLTQVFNYYKTRMTEDQIKEFKEFYL